MIFCDHKEEERTGLACEHLLEKKKEANTTKGDRSITDFLREKALSSRSSAERARKTRRIMGPVSGGSFVTTVWSRFPAAGG